jgi:hypothetical protein
MDIRIRLVKVGAGAPDYSCLGHADDGRAILFLSTLRLGACGATARQMRLPVRYSFAAKGNFITDAHGPVDGGPFCGVIARILARVGIACAAWR